MSDYWRAIVNKTTATANFVKPRRTARFEKITSPNTHHYSDEQTLFQSVYSVDAPADEAFASSRMRGAQRYETDDEIARRKFIELPSALPFTVSASQINSPAAAPVVAQDYLKPIQSKSPPNAKSLPPFAPPAPAEIVNDSAKSARQRTKNHRPPQKKRGADLNHVEIIDDSKRQDLASEKPRVIKPRVAMTRRRATEANAHQTLIAPSPHTQLEKTAAAATAPKFAAPPIVNISIGRVEIRAVAAPASPAKKARNAAKTLSLDDYLRNRREANDE